MTLCLRSHLHGVSMKKRFVVIFIVSLWTTVTAAELRVMTLNAEWLWTPFDHKVDGSKFNKGDMSEADYLAEISFYASLVSQHNVQILAISEIENSLVAAHLAGKLGGRWRAYFKQGRDTATGQDVAILSNLQLVKGTVTDFGFPSGTIDGSNKSKRLSKLVGAQFWEGKADVSSKVGVITSHFLSKRNDSKAKSDNRQRQAVALVKAVNKVRKETDKLIVMGDFNDYLHTPTLVILRDQKRLLSVSVGARKDKVRIDHILYQGLREKQSQLVDLKTYSDHDALMSVFY